MSGPISFRHSRLTTFSMSRRMTCDIGLAITDHGPNDKTIHNWSLHAWNEYHALFKFTTVNLKWNLHSITNRHDPAHKGTISYNETYDRSRALVLILLVESTLGRSYEETMRYATIGFHLIFLAAELNANTILWVLYVWRSTFNPCPTSMCSFAGSGLFFSLNSDFI